MWKNVYIADSASAHFGIPARILNDANACALAEWRYGAGMGTRNMVFLTCGTDIGAGLILNGAIYEGSTGVAGEFGHIRAERFGPTGCGKSGSFEGFCSDIGIAELAKNRALEIFQNGGICTYCKSPDTIQSISAKTLAEAAENGDSEAIKIFGTAGDFLGRGIAILIDLLNPEPSS